MRKKIWVAFSGKAGCGKSTIAKNLVRDFGFVKMSFAKKLKEICKDLYPEIMKAPKEKHRKLLQDFGSFCRVVQHDCWIQVVVNQIHDLNRVAIDDIRFVNEYDVLRKLGFKLIRVERGPLLRLTWGYNVKDTHPSETQLDHLKIEDWDLFIMNDGPHPFEEATEAVAKFLDLEKEGTFVRISM